MQDDSSRDAHQLVISRKPGNACNGFVTPPPCKARGRAAWEKVLTCHYARVVRPFPTSETRGPALPFASSTNGHQKTTKKKLDDDDGGDTREHPPTKPSAHHELSERTAAPPATMAVGERVRWSALEVHNVIISQGIRLRETPANGLTAGPADYEIFPTFDRARAPRGHRIISWKSQIVTWQDVRGSAASYTDSVTTSIAQAGKSWVTSQRSVSSVPLHIWTI
nr:hypothetical protein CFP56_72357 [Quercus suber]